MSTIKVDFDRDRWLYVPEFWPWQQFASVEDWAGTIARLVQESAELDAERGEWLRASITSIHNDRPEGENRFIYLAEPDKFIFFVSVLHGPSRPAISVDTLAGIDDPAATRAPDVENLQSAALGRGIRAVRYVDAGAPNHDVAAIAQYAWRSQDMDVVVIAANYGIVLLNAMLPIVDEFALSISVVDD